MDFRFVIMFRLTVLPIQPPTLWISELFSRG